MKTIGVIPNTLKDKDLARTNELVRRISQSGRVPLLTGGIKAAGAETVPPEEFYRLCDMIAVLGGDGTILRAAKQAAAQNKPILGINLGGLGYLTDVDGHRGVSALESVFAGNYKSEKRMMLSLDNDSTALNDVCVSRGVFTKLISIEIYVNGEYVDTVRADGLIAATPTGSTAYNLSAGGPILKPDSEMIAITAICPHELLHRPWVVSARDVISLRVAGKTPGALVSLDGQPHAEISAGRELTIRRSEHYTTILKTSGLSFYEILRGKMGVCGIER